jgi:hypothetical protein
MPDRLSPQKRKSYADRPQTPVGTTTGFTEEKAIKPHEPEPTQPQRDPYRYQPAYFWSHPAAYIRETSNYLKACAARIPLSGRSTPTPDRVTQNGAKSNGDI